MAADLGKLLRISSAEAMDLSAPLSTPDLHQLLDRMQAESDGKRVHVRKTLRSNHHKFLDLISEAEQGMQHVEGISRDLVQLLELVDAAGSVKLGMAPPIHTTKGLAFHVELRQLTDEARSINKQKEEKEQALALVDSIASIHESIKDAKEEFMLGHIVEAAADMQRLRQVLLLPSSFQEEFYEQLLQELQDSENLKAYVALKLSWTETLSQFRSILDDLFIQTTLFDTVERKVSATSTITYEAFTSVCEVERTTIFRAMDRLGLLDTRLAKMADMFFKMIILPIVEEPLAMLIVESPTIDTHGRTMAVLRLSSSNALQAEVSSLELLCSKILQAVKFLRRSISDSQDSLIKRVGRLIWPRLAEAIISKHIKKIVPVETFQLADFQRVAKVVAEFENELKKEKFLADLGSDSDRLSEFTLDVESHFALKKKKIILAKARHLLVRFDYQPLLRDLGNTSKDSVDSSKNCSELLFQPETCAVSIVANQLLSLVHGALKEASLSTSRTAIQLYYAARDCVLLFRAIMPVKLVGAMPNSDQIAALYHNDCLYIAHELLALAYEYRASLPAGVKEVFTFVDLVPLFRCMAEDSLMERVQKISSTLMRALDDGNGLRCTDEIRYREMASQALDHVLRILADICGQWKPLLPQSVYSKVINLLLEIVISRLTKELLSLDDIAAEETVQLRNLLVGFMERLEALVDMNHSASKELLMDQKEAGIRDFKIEERVASWRKLRRCSDLLDMSLIPITQAWESGDLSRCGFTSAEVQKIVKAIFTDTSLRKESLRRISAT